MSEAGLIGFAERCLALLDRGAFSAWPHTSPFRNALLRQNNTQQAAIVTLICQFREGCAGEPLGRAKLIDSPRYDRLVKKVEWKLIQMPLPRLQFVGTFYDPFLYDIGWTSNVRPSDAIDRTIRFREGAPEMLVRLAGLLRPLIQREWMSMVARFNPTEVQDAQLEKFLFGRNRVMLEPVRDDLRELQGNRCFYCEGSLGKSAAVDHFLPWSRHPNDAIENLVVADPACNTAKRDFLAATEHVGRWRQRLLRSDLGEIASRRRWERAPERTEGVARALYLRLPEGAKLWRRGGDFVMAEGALLRRALGS